MAETYRPPKGVQDEAQRALKWIADGKAGSGFTDTGRARAAQLARGDALSAETVLRMYSYLSRHEVDKQGKGFNPGDEGYPSPGRVAWAAWGGDPGLAWSSRIRDQLAERTAMLEEAIMETRDLPPSYRPSESEDVPVFRPSCATCAYFTLSVDPTSGEASGSCAKWDAGCDPNGYCDAWESHGENLPGWLKDDEEAEESAVEVEVEIPLEANAADPEVEERKSLLEACEKRSIPAELRAETMADGTVRVRGYAAVFNQEATGLPFREVIAPGAFARSLDRGDDVFLLVNHDTDQLPLARRSSGTLTLSEDENGLLIDAELDPANPRAAEVASVLARQDASEMSFAFKVADGGSRKREDGVRELSDLDLFEVSIVTWGAYNQTSVGLRSAEDDDLAQRWLLKKWELKRAKYAH